MVYQDAATGEKEHVENLEEPNVEIIQTEVNDIKDLHQPFLNNPSDILPAIAFEDNKTHDQSPNTSGPVSFTSTYSPPRSFINPAVLLSLRGGGLNEPASGEAEETTHLSPREDSLNSLPSTTLVGSPPLPSPLQRSPIPQTTAEWFETLQHELERMVTGSFILSGLIFHGVGNKLADKLAALSGTKLRDMSAIRNE